MNTETPYSKTTSYIHTQPSSSSASSSSSSSSSSSMVSTDWAELFDSTFSSLSPGMNPTEVASGGVSAAAGGVNNKENLPSGSSMSRLSTQCVNLPPSGKENKLIRRRETSYEDEEDETSLTPTTRAAQVKDVKWNAEARHEASKIYWLHTYSSLFSYIKDRSERASKCKQFIESLPVNERDAEWKDYCGRERANLRNRRIRKNFTDYEIIAQVGQGGYGEVFLARPFKEKMDICAIKRVPKQAILQMNDISNIRNERNVLSSSNSEWLVKLLSSFQDNFYVYMVMEYIPGGDLRTLLDKSGPMSESHARWYLAEVLLCVNSLHQLGFFHRDLKPENILIDANGHLKLTDFGFAKGSFSKSALSEMAGKVVSLNNDATVSAAPANSLRKSVADRRKLFNSVKPEERRRAISKVGSPDYMAPEILWPESEKGYDHAIDYWAVGCMFYEFLAEFPPFYDTDQIRVFQNIRNWEEELQRPDNLHNQSTSDEAWDLIKLFIAPASKRMCKVRDCQSHPFFKNFKWDHIRESRAPWRPSIKSEVDVSHFDDFSKNLPHYAAKADAPAVNMPRNVLAGWTYRSDVV